MGRPLLLSSVPHFSSWRGTLGEPFLFFAHPYPSSVTLAAMELLVGLVGPQIAASHPAVCGVSLLIRGLVRKEGKIHRAHGRGVCMRKLKLPQDFTAPQRMQIFPFSSQPPPPSGGPLGSVQITCTGGANHDTNFGTSSSSGRPLELRVPSYQGSRCFCEGQGSVCTSLRRSLRSGVQTSRSTVIGQSPIWRAVWAGRMVVCHLKRTKCVCVCVHSCACTHTHACTHAHVCLLPCSRFQQHSGGNASPFLHVFFLVPASQRPLFISPPPPPAKTTGCEISQA